MTRNLISPIVPFFTVNEKSANDTLLMNTVQASELDEATFYNNLPQTLEKAWLLLEDAAHTRYSPMYTPVLVSSGKDQTAHARMVVLRDNVRTARELRIHTDSRSAKVEELHRQPTCQVLAYHPVQKIQLRLDATSSIRKTTFPARSGHRHRFPAASAISRKKQRLHAPANPPPAFLLTLKTVSPKQLSHKWGFATLPQ